jgi:hypothetical protein
VISMCPTCAPTLHHGAGWTGTRGKAVVRERQGVTASRGVAARPAMDCSLTVYTLQVSLPAPTTPWSARGVMRRLRLHNLSMDSGYLSPETLLGGAGGASSSTWTPYRCRRALSVEIATSERGTVR